MAILGSNFPNVPQAIIIGGGPAGLATALRLQQKTDISCTIYELRPEPVALGGALGIPSNGLRLLSRLGLHADVLARGNSRSNLAVRSLQGNVLGEQDFVGQAAQKTGFGYVRIKRTDLLDVLLLAIRKADIPLHYNKNLIAIEENNAGVVVTFSDGTIDTADMLLGCDGIHSQVRRLYVDPPQKPEYSGFAGMGSVVPASALTGSSASQIKNMTATLTEEGMFVAMPCTALGEEIMWSFLRQIPLPDSSDSRDGWEVHGKEELDVFKSTILGLLENGRGEWENTMREIIEKTSVANLYPIYRLPIGGKWSKGRCLLLGDAAHAMQPHAGQGVSMALEDGFLLAKFLEDRTRSLSDVYQRFDEIRRPHVDNIVKLSSQNANIRKKTGPWGLWFKELGVWAVMGVSGILRLGTWGSAQRDLVYDVEEEDF